MLGRSTPHHRRMKARMTSSQDSIRRTIHQYRIGRPRVLPTRGDQEDRAKASSSHNATSLAVQFVWCIDPVSCMAAEIVYHTGSCHRRSSRIQGLLFAFLALLSTCATSRPATTCHDPLTTLLHTRPPTLLIIILFIVHAICPPLRWMFEAGLLVELPVIMCCIYIPRYRNAIH